MKSNAHFRSILRRAADKRLFLLAVASTFIFGLCVTTVEFHEIPVSDLKSFFVVAGQWLVVTVAALPVFMLLLANRWVALVTLPLLGLLCGVFVYLRLSFHITPTPELVEIIAANDPALGKDFISFRSMTYALLGLFAGAAIAWWRMSKVASTGLQSAAMAALGIAGIVLATSVSPRLLDSISARMPYSFVHSVRGFLRNRKPQFQRETLPAGAECTTDSCTIVVVLGESLRADHLQLNGYCRATTPLLAADTAVVSFTHMYSPEYVTHKSLPVILTRASDIDDLRAWQEHSFISLLDSVGFRTAWISNQDALTNLNKRPEEHGHENGTRVKGVATYHDFMLEADTLIYANGGKSDYVYSKWTDSSLLPHLDRELSGHNPHKLIILHTIGSHWFYNSHFTEPVFKPILTSKTNDLAHLDALINSYDNTVVETDRFLADIIRRLHDRNAIMLYISDHGESLGEGGRFLHSGDFPELHRPACIVWCSPLYSISHPGFTEALRDNADKPLSTETIFHTVVEGADINTPVLDKSKSLFRK